MPVVLALDTSAAACSVAVVARGRLCAHRMEEMERGHAQALVPMVRAAMDEANVAFDALGLIAVTRGPGAFTGIRIGLAAARGLAFAAGKPCLGVGTLETLAAASSPPDRPLLVAMDTRRGDFYAQLFTPGPHEASPPVAVDAAGLARLVAATGLANPAAAGLGSGAAIRVIGDAAAAAAAALTAAGFVADAADAPRLPDAAWVARVALARWRPGERPSMPRPLYIRAPAITMPS